MIKLPIRIETMSTLPLLMMAIAFGLLSSTATGREHPISVISTDAYVSRTKVNLRLQLFAEDLYLFQDLEPDRFDKVYADQLLPAMERHKSFLLERVIIRDADGEALSGKIVSLEPFEIPEEGIPVGQLMQYKMTYQMEFDVEEPPEFLTFSQEIVDADFLYPSEMQLFLKQSGSESSYQTVLRPDDPYTARFNWDSPPLSPEADEEAWEAWFNEQREETLGITSYGSVYSFIYITRTEVRHEVLIPLGTLATLFTIEREDKNFLSVEEQSNLRPTIEEFLKKENPVLIDGLQVQPIFDRVDFHGLSFRDFAMQAEPTRVSMASGRVGVIMRYPAKTPPKQVEVTWTLFGPNIVSVESIVFAYDKTQKTKFSRFKEETENTFVWADDDVPAMPSLTAVDSEFPDPPKRSIPTVSLIALGLIIPLAIFLSMRKTTIGTQLVLSGVLVAVASAAWPFFRWEINDPYAAKPEIKTAYKEEVFQRLHSNTYRAFDYRTESDIYDALANSVDGELLNDLYLSIMKNLQMQSQGGAVAEIQEVAITEGESEADPEVEVDWPGFVYDCRWVVRGSVEHWGHIHERTNEYTGRFKIEPKENQWKITEMELLDEEQIRVETRLRKF